jgi:hypothetical protein
MARTSFTVAPVGESGGAADAPPRWNPNRLIPARHAAVATPNLTKIENRIAGPYHDRRRRGHPSDHRACLPAHVYRVARNFHLFATFAAMLTTRTRRFSAAKGSSPCLPCSIFTIFSRSVSVRDRVALFLKLSRNCVSSAFIAGSGGGAVRLSRLRVRRLGFKASMI